MYYGKNYWYMGVGGFTYLLCSSLDNPTKQEQLSTEIGVERGEVTFPSLHNCSAEEMSFREGISDYKDGALFFLPPWL